MYILRLNNKKGLFSACLVAFILLILNNLVFGTIEHFFFPDLPKNPITNESPFYKLIFGCIIGPILETYVFNYLPTIILHKINIKKESFRIILPSIIFGLNHYYSFLYIIAAFFMGIIFNLLYLRATKLNESPILVVSLIHCAYNIFSLFIV